MRVLVYGAGAIGAYLGGLLTESGVDVTLLARGAQLEALARDGLSLTLADGRTRKIAVKTCRSVDTGYGDTRSGDTGGRFDLVFVTLKSMQLAAAAADIAAMLAPGGDLVMIQNGLPWWYFDHVDSPWRGTTLASLDADGVLARGYDLTRVIGAVIYKPVMVTAPGQIKLPSFDGDKLILGEIDNCVSERVQRIAAMVSAAGLPAEVSADIRLAKWRKLASNLVWNPLSALTQSPPGRIAATAGGAALVRDMMREGNAVAAAVGMDTGLDAESELRRVKGNFTQQPSMLQDLRAGRALEWDAILNVVIEIAGLTGVAVPALQHVAACVGLIDQRIRDDGVAFVPVPVKK